MKSKRLRIAAIAGCMLGLLVCAEAQKIRGTVTDPSGAVVIGAKITLLAADHEILSTESDEQGLYSLTFGDGGCTHCTLSCWAPGFAALTQEVNVTLAEQLSLPIRLAIEGEPQSVGVEAQLQPWRQQLDVGDLRESAARDVGEALTQIDGVNKIRKGGIANDIVVRGFQQNNVNVSIDGARIYGACPGHMDPPVQHVDFSEVERVDVAAGAYDVTSAGSLGAKVNIVTKKPPLGLHFTPSFAFGSFGFYNPSVTASAGNNRLRVLLGYSYRVSEPFNDGQGKSFLTITNYNPMAWKQHAFEINTGWFEADFSPTENQTMSLRYTRQDAGTVLYPYLTMDSGYDNADIGSFKYEVRNLAGWVRAIRLNTYLTEVSHSMDNRFRTTAMGGAWTMSSIARSLTTGAVLEADVTRDLTIGTEGYYRDWNMMGYMKMGGMMTANQSLPDVGTNLIGGFAAYHHAFSDRLNLTAGARFDHAFTAANADNLNTTAYYVYQNTRQTSATDNYGSGSARLTYSPAGSVQLFAALGTTGRVPDGEERFINRLTMTSVNVGNPNLPYVRNTEGTVGAIYRHGSSMYVKPTFFYSSVDNYIVVNNQPRLNDPMMSMLPSSATSYTNIGARLYGGELEYGLSLPYGFSLNGGGGYTKGGGTLKPQAGVLCANLPEMPPLRAWTALRYVHNYIFAEVGGIAASAQDLVDTDLKETPTPGWGVMNVKLGASYKKLYAIFVVENLIGHEYYAHLSYFRNPFASGVKVPVPGRNYFAQVKFSF